MSSESRRAQIVALLERVRAAKGPDRGVDEAVRAAFGYPPKPWNYTSSLDAVVALIERELPDAVWSIKTDFGGYVGAGIALDLDGYPPGPYITETAETPVLSALAAFLSAYLQTLPEEA